MSSSNAERRTGGKAGGDLSDSGTRRSVGCFLAAFLDDEPPPDACTTDDDDDDDDEDDDNDCVSLPILPRLPFEPLAVAAGTNPSDGDDDADDTDEDTVDDGSEAASGVAAFESGVAGTSNVTHFDGVKKAGDSVSAINLPPRGVVFCGLFWWLAPPPLLPIL